MFYIHNSTCISPQKTLLNPDPDQLTKVVDNKLKAVEPSYAHIPPAVLRRMGKAVRIGVSAALPLINATQKVDGLIIGTANGGMEDCIKFLNQIIEYEEGTLTPTNFVQSTTNAIASQLALLSENKGYNITHVHRGLAFENATLDAAMLLKENPENKYLLGGVEEISSYNYNINYLGGCYKKEPVHARELYDTDTAGSIAGEGAALFLVSGIKESAIALLQAQATLHTKDELTVKERLKTFLKENLKPSESIDLLIIGENGDNRLLKYYSSVESVLGGNTPVVRYKHLTGEYETVSAVSLFIAYEILKGAIVPTHMLKSGTLNKKNNKILIYNTSKGYQHSFLILSKV